MEREQFQRKRVSHFAENLQNFTRMMLSTFLYCRIAEMLGHLYFVAKSKNAAQIIEVFRKSSNRK